MSYYPLKLPETLLKEIQRLAEENQVSIEQWLLNAVTEKIEAQKVVRLLHSYAEKADYNRFDAILASVPDTEPIAGNELG
ncbi:CopG family transcriptional regulator [Moorena producens PAL-8-15-08-1]|uniref:CopG family transcriptional regulator n=1 Tax=Moorena producens PAL-8-15-08-1 TaxID=1458985 RepID=A0A1D8TRE3_9CYAN|nr:CopG family transcriptional regulator [Moorena producens]AOX00209.1 CopG family transcriptional regulator [Moorena producens PAL-8-15-08-1]